MSELVSIPEDELKRLLIERDQLRDSLTHTQERCGQLLEECREAKREIRGLKALIDVFQKFEIGKHV